MAQHNNKMFKPKMKNMYSYIVHTCDVQYIPFRGWQANHKSANCWAYSAIANLQLPLGVPVRKSQIRKFLWLIRRSQIRKFPQNTAQICLKTSQKSLWSFKIGWVRNSKICKVSHFRKVHKSEKLFMSPNFRICNMRTLYADRPPLSIS